MEEDLEKVRRKNEKTSFVEALVTSEGFLIFVYGDSNVNRKLMVALTKYGLYAETQFCSPCG